LQALNPEKALNCYGNAKVMTILVSLAEKTFKLIHWKRLSDQIVNLGNNFSYPLMLSRVLNKEINFIVINRKLQILKHGSNQNMDSMPLIPVQMKFYQNYFFGL
jgi:hypothetical protein